jgi:hypothetical protein
LLANESFRTKDYKIGSLEAVNIEVQTVVRNRDCK